MSRRAQIEAMLAKSPADVFLLYGLAMELVTEGDVDAGVRQFQRVLEADPNYQAAFFQLGQVLSGAGRIDEAKDWLVRGIEVAGRIGNHHAAGEMQGFLDQLD